jgi:ABC-2 type transport system permease protein
MNAILIIVRRELAAYFTSPLSYVIAAAFLILTGVQFNNDVTVSISQRPVDPALIPDLLSQVLVLLAPLLTMRLLAEESREGTIELLLTAPISETSIVIGKFLGAWIYYTFLLLLTLPYQFILVGISSPDLAHTVTAHLGIWLYGGATLAVGLMFSAMTENQILAAFLSTVTLLTLYLGENIGKIVANVDVALFLYNLVLRGHYAPSFAVGIVRAEDIIYFVGMIVIMLFIAIRLLEARRWS